MKIKKIDIFEGKDNLNYLFFGNTPEEDEQEEQTIEEEEESEEGQEEEGQEQEGQEVEQQQEGQEETEETPEEEEEQQEEEEKKKGIENEEEEDKPLEEPTTKTSEDTHGGDEATNSIENSPNSSEEGKEEAQQEQEGQEQGQEEQQEEDKEEAEEGNKQEEGQEQEGNENEAENGEEHKPSGKEGNNEGEGEEQEEEGEGQQQEGQEGEEESQEVEEQQEEGEEVEENENENNDEQEDTENYDNSTGMRYNNKSLAKVRTDMRTGNLATRFSTFISKFAKQPSYLHKSGKKEIDIRRAIKRSITKEPIDTVYVDNNKKTVILFLDDSGSMEPFTNLLSILASIATKRGDAVIIHAPNGHPYIPLEDLLNPSKRAKILRDLSKVGINITPAMIKKAVDEGYDEVDIGDLVRKTLKNQKIIFVGDYDGYFFPIELSRNNDVVWLAPVIEDLDYGDYDLHKDFKGMFVKLLTEDELRDAINELARIGYKPKTFLNFIKNYDIIADNEDDYEEEEEQTN